MSAEAKKGLLPEGGEMLVLAFVLALLTSGLLGLMYVLAPKA